jgi:hypothetical protein
MVDYLPANSKTLDIGTAQKTLRGKIHQKTLQREQKGENPQRWSPTKNCKYLQNKNSWESFELKGHGNPIR